MAIHFTSDRYFQTDVGHKIFQNVPLASQWFKFRVNSAGSVGGVVNGFLSKAPFFDFWHQFVGGGGGSVTVRFSCTNSAGSFAQVDLPLAIGVVYGIAITWDGVTGHQKVWLSGVPTQFGTFTGNTQNNSSPLQIGLSAALVVDYSLDDHNIWDNYLLTPGDISSLLSGTDPTTIGTSATWRGRWTLAGTTGASPVIGDAGLKNAYGGGGALPGGDGSDCISAGGAGTAVYAPALVWAPTVTATPYVATSGKIIAGTLASNIDGSLQVPSQLLATPTLTVNGTNLGPLINPWFSGYHKCFFYATPNNLQINPGDIASLTAPAAWCNTAAGSVAALSGPIDNRSGKSSVGSDINPRTLRMGVNHSLAPTLPGLGFYFPFKNYNYRRTAWPPFSHGAVSQNVSLQIANSGGNNSLDATNEPGAAGKWLFVWDATNPANPIIITGATNDPTHTAVTQHPELSSNGISGVGMCRVTDFQHVSPTGPAVLDIEVNFSDPLSDNVTPHYSRLWIFAPGDWSIQNGVAVYDRSDPLALSATYTGRLTDQVGTLRWVDSSACGGNPASFPYPEPLNSTSDETWGDLSQRVVQYGFSAVGPVNTAATPWIYSPFFRQAGQSFTATLTQNITTTPAVGTNEVYTFSDAATAPLMAGLEVTAGSEVMRIIKVVGTSVTVYRGSNGTTPATHTAGTVTVNGRRAITSVLTAGGGLANNIVWQLTTATPHGITAGNGFNMIGWTGPAGSGGQLTWSDGTVLNPTAFVRTTWVTGPNTVVSTCGLFSDGRTPVLTATQALDPTTNYSQVQYISAIPYAAVASASGRFSHASVHVNVPMDASDDMVYHIARIFRDNFPAGRHVYVEYANEPWNWAFAAFGYLTAMGPLVMPGWPVMYQGQVNLYAYYVYRAAQVHTIFRNVFTAAGRTGEVMGLLNKNAAADSGLYLEFAAAQGITVDAIAIAPYLDMEINPLNASAINLYDDEQAVDMWTHELYYNTRTYSAWIALTKQGITVYNAATGKNCVLMGYEGGAEFVVPWTNLTTHWNERNHDILYNPNWYIAEQDFYYWLQLQGFTALHVYSLSQYWNPEGWGMYHGLLQDHGRGDGSDGKANNLLYRANPDAVHYKGANVCQDDRCVSVRGQAFIDWNATVNAVLPPPATAYAVTVPSPASGQVGVASGNFFVTPNGPYTGTITITPSGGGLSTPVVLTWLSSSASQSFVITPVLAGAVTLTFTNSGGLTDQSPATYTATAQTAASAGWLGYFATPWFGRSFSPRVPPASRSRFLTDRRRERKVTS